MLESFHNKYLEFHEVEKKCVATAVCADNHELRSVSLSYLLNEAETDSVHEENIDEGDTFY
jgi:hypothetical protein